jgi:hypothetical protein
MVTPNKGTIGAINATITWTAEGVRQSFNAALKEATSLSQECHK